MTSDPIALWQTIECAIEEGQPLPADAQRYLLLIARRLNTLKPMVIDRKLTPQRGGGRYLVWSRPERS